MTTTFYNRTEWRQAGLLHRIDGPAIIYNNGAFKYYIGGDLHRTDGPAYINSQGHIEYHINGSELTKEEFDMYNFVKNI